MSSRKKYEGEKKVKPTMKKKNLNLVQVSTCTGIYSVVPLISVGLDLRSDESPLLTPTQSIKSCLISILRYFILKKIKLK